MSVVIGLALLAPSLAGAQEAHSWYLAGAVSGSRLEKPSQTIANAPNPGATLSATNAVKTGWGGRLALGRQWGSVRVEGEIGRSENKSKAYSAISPISITLPQDGETNATRYMVNGYYDLPHGLFLGGGLGAADVEVKTFAAPARAPTAPPSQLLDYKDSRFAYQLMAGAARRLNDHWALEAQYRWFDAGEAVGKDSRGERATRKMRGHNLDVGLRYSF